MKIMKWVCRYAFLVLLLAGAVAWCLYCNSCLTELNDTVYSLKYIDLAASLSQEATDLLARIAYYDELLQTGITISIILGSCLLVLIAYHIISVIVLKKRAEKAAFTSAPAAAPYTSMDADMQPSNSCLQTPDTASDENDTAILSEEPVQEGVYCTQCGQYYHEKPAFCTECGCPMDGE